MTSKLVGVDEVVSVMLWDDFSRVCEILDVLTDHSPMKFASFEDGKEATARYIENLLREGWASGFLLSAKRKMEPVEAAVAFKHVKEALDKARTWDELYLDESIWFKGTEANAAKAQRIMVSGSWQVYLAQRRNNALNRD